MMVKLLLSLITTFLFVPLYAQIESGSYARGFIHLKDGRVIKGDYIYTSDLEKIQIVSQQSTFVLDASEVEFISKNRPPRIKQDKTDNFDEVVVSNNRFFNLSEMGLLVGNPENRQSAPFVVSSSFNYSVFSKLSFGLGSGVEFLHETYVPATVNAMYNLRSGRTVPFLILHGGYLFPIEKSRTSYGAIINNGNAPGMIWPWPVEENTPFKAKGGFLVNPAIGIFSQTRSGYAITISAGYRFHRLNYAANNDYSLDVDYNRLTIKLGIIIN